MEYTVIFGYSYRNIRICICTSISIYIVYNIQTADSMAPSFVKFCQVYHAFARTHTSVYFGPILLLHEYTLHSYTTKYTLHYVLYVYSNPGQVPDTHRGQRPIFTLIANSGSLQKFDDSCTARIFSLHDFQTILNAKSYALRGPLSA